MIFTTTEKLYLEDLRPDRYLLAERRRLLDIIDGELRELRLRDTNPEVLLEIVNFLSARIPKKVT